jgi:hypothetical protein
MKCRVAVQDAPNGHFLAPLRGTLYPSFLAATNLAPLRGAVAQLGFTSKTKQQAKNSALQIGFWVFFHRQHLAGALLVTLAAGGRFAAKKLAQ